MDRFKKESHSVTTRKRKSVHEEYMLLTSDMKRMDLIIILRSHNCELLPLEVGNTTGPMDDTKYWKDHNERLFGRFVKKLHFKKVKLEEVFTLGIQIIHSVFCFFTKNS